MPRVKRGTTHVKKRRKVLKQAKGYKWGRKSHIKLAKTAVTKAGAHAYRDRRNKKRTNRALWQIKINAAVRRNDLSYSKFMNMLKSKNIEIDRKVLADIAENEPKTFEGLVNAVK